MPGYRQSLNDQQLWQASHSCRIEETFRRRAKELLAEII